MRARALIAPILAVAFVSGCVVLPHPIIPQKLPFNDEDLAFVDPGETTREQLEATVGSQPLRHFEGKDILIHADVRRVGGVTFVGCFEGPESISTFHYLVVWYDEEDRVR